MLPMYIHHSKLGRRSHETSFDSLCSNIPTYAVEKGNVILA